MSKPSAFWRTTSRTAGSTCQEHVPQIAGAPEGAEGAFRGLRLHTDASDRTWRLMSGNRIVRRGTAGDPAPTPLQALQMARPAAARRLTAAEY